MDEQEPKDTTPQIATAAVLYSASSDLYCLPHYNKTYWLTVAIYPLPVPESLSNDIYLGTRPSVDGGHYRQAYARSWQAIVPGHMVTLPVTDPLVLDYLAEPQSE